MEPARAAARRRRGRGWGVRRYTILALLALAGCGGGAQHQRPPPSPQPPPIQGTICIDVDGVHGVNVATGERVVLEDLRGAWIVTDCACGGEEPRAGG